MKIRAVLPSIIFLANINIYIFLFMYSIKYHNKYIGTEYRKVIPYNIFVYISTFLCIDKVQNMVTLDVPLLVF